MMNNLELPESPYLEFVVYSCILRPPPKKEYRMIFIGYAY